MYYEQAFKSNYTVRLVDDSTLNLTEIYYGGPMGRTPMLHGFNTADGEERRVPLALVADRTIRMALSLELMNNVREEKPNVDEGC